MLALEGNFPRFAHLASSNLAVALKGRLPPGQNHGRRRHGKLYSSRQRLLRHQRWKPSSCHFEPAPYKKQPPQKQAQNKP
jgi:hypothetical protein